MEKPQSLADYLGLPDDPKAPLDSSLLNLKEIEDGEELGRAILNSIEFRQYLYLGLRLGTLPGFTSILGRFIDHAIGKAPERHEHTGKDGQPIEMITEVRRTIVRVPQDEKSEQPYVTH